MFLLKKIVGALAEPLTIAVLILALGVVLLWASRRQRSAKVLVTAALALLVVGSYGWLSGPALLALEHSYPPLDVASAQGVKWIVVIGGGTSGNTEIPETSRPLAATLARIVEGVRLHRLLPDSRLLVSGGAYLGTGSDAESMAAVARALGVAEADIIGDRISLDTETQARVIAGRLKGERFILVTSAAHMRRSMALFRKAGSDPLPAPTQFLSGGASTVEQWLPNARNLAIADLVLHEYLGIAWAAMTGRI